MNGEYELFRKCIEVSGKYKVSVILRIGHSLVKFEKGSFGIENKDDKMNFVSILDDVLNDKEGILERAYENLVRRAENKLEKDGFELEGEDIVGMYAKLRFPYGHYTGYEGDFEYGKITFAKRFDELDGKYLYKYVSNYGIEREVTRGELKIIEKEEY